MTIDEMHNQQTQSAHCPQPLSFQLVDSQKRTTARVEWTSSTRTTLQARPVLGTPPEGRRAHGYIRTIPDDIWVQKESE